MKRSDMIEAVERLLNASGTETELDTLLDKLVLALPHGGISDLIYYPEDSFSAENIVEKALQRERDWQSQVAR